MIGGMTADVISFPEKPTADFLLQKIRAAAAVSGNIEFDHPHAKKRLAERHLSMRHLLECLRAGEVNDGPTRDQYGDWRIRLMRYVAGRRVQVVVAVKPHRIVVVTVI